MTRYQSRRHRYLMDESEQALSDAADGKRRRDARIARQILGDSRFHRLWESRHAELVTPVAEYSQRNGQIFKLREIEVKLLHRRALVRCIREHGIVGVKRDKLMAVFYGPKEPRDAILAEHRQYTLAVSSRVSADHLIDVMHDPVSIGLLKSYESIYSKYFDLYCFNVTCDDKAMVEATWPEMASLRLRAFQMIKRIYSERPESGHASFEREALLARSGRYPMQEYMVG